MGLAARPGFARYHEVLSRARWNGRAVARKLLVQVAIFFDIIERETGGGRVGARPAAAIRNSVALAELPAALARMIKLPGQSLAFAPIGAKALPAYRRAAELDPDEPWTWIAIAWMGEAGGTDVAEVESAVDKGEAAAWAARDDDAVIAALHVRARFDWHRDGRTRLRARSSRP
jgi:hypothetical protein